ncbi:hypothetical protein BU16DRAFT_572358 [Lophium mytilinum]|uniref:Inclusion body clearance protein IML2 n=1 Tax=Lophium mytilinum TaxID=390894 RepID=A0A6A6QUU3_9PEZI|nr:hypothetical protein BU16DRAFT_572358 [Lophium mytilinum]
MNDDVDGAEAGLDQGSSSFHKLGKGVIIFMRATLGFEPEVMRAASEALNEAENSAYEHQRKAHREPHTYRSPIYPPGAEYAVCLAQAQLMSAVVGVLNESLTESIKGFYKLRKAYLTLEGVMAAERRYINDRSTSSVDTTTTGSTTSSMPSPRLSTSKTETGKTRTSAVPSANPRLSSTTIYSNLSKEPEKEKLTAIEGDDEFVDADEAHPDLPTPKEYIGHLAVETADGKTIEIDTSSKSPYQSSSATSDAPPYSPSSASDDFEKLTLQDTIKETQDITAFGTHPVDTFIVSASNFCFGVLMLIISLVPPAFAMLLKIVGFKGDRERGIQMLWQASKFNNINGAMAGLVLFGYYNGLNGFCDIIPQSGEGSYPRPKCKALLAEMRVQYPKSHLWLIEEARMMATEKRLEDAVEYQAKCGESPLKQLEALQWFERSLNTMYLHGYEDCSKAFQKCVELNNWSHGLYYYICGAAHVELYRLNKSTNPEEAKRQATLARDFLALVTKNTGKKRFMARQLPFDTFVNRKIQKWEQRAAEWNCDLIDAIGVSPLEEMIYFWNGYKRMRPEHLEVSMQRLAWSESSENTFWDKEGRDEKAILALLRAATYRALDQTDKAREVLKAEVLSHDRAVFKGGNKDNWTAPCAHYEMAACLWRDVELGGQDPALKKEELTECAKWLEDVVNWGGFDLDARIGMKVTTAKQTLRRFGVGIV